MTITEAYSKCQPPGFDTSFLSKQQRAFAECLSFIQRLEPTKSTNRRRNSSTLKTIVQNPAGNFGIESDQSCRFGYVYEGTFVLAAIAAGLKPTFTGTGITATFNYSERSLQAAARDLAATRLKRV